MAGPEESSCTAGSRGAPKGQRLRLTDTREAHPGCRAEGLRMGPWHPGRERRESRERGSLAGVWLWEVRDVGGLRVLSRSQMGEGRCRPFERGKLRQGADLGEIRMLPGTGKCKSPLPGGMLSHQVDGQGGGSGRRRGQRRRGRGMTASEDGVWSPMAGRRRGAGTEGPGGWRHAEVMFGFGQNHA